jgi:hypothetical protein
MKTNLDAKLRLDEISRRHAELSAASSMLTDMALQLDRLRRLTGTTELLTGRDRFRHNSGRV